MPAPRCSWRPAQFSIFQAALFLRPLLWLALAVLLCFRMRDADAAEVDWDDVVPSLAEGLAALAHSQSLAIVPADASKRSGMNRLLSQSPKRWQFYRTAQHTTGNAWPLWQAVLAIHGILLIFLFTLLHECVHKTPFATQRLSTVVAAVCGFILLLPAQWFTYFHLAHHRHTHDPKHDPELAAPKPRSLGGSPPDGS